MVAQIRIVLVGPTTRGGGAERVLAAWWRHFIATGAQVELVLTEVAADAESGPIARVLSKSLWNRVHELRAIVRGSDVVLSIMPYWNLLSLVATLGLRPKPRVIISEHTLHAAALRLRSTAFRAQTWVARLLYRRAHALIAVSHPVAAEMCRAYSVSPTRTWVVPNPLLEDRAPIGRLRERQSPSTNSISVVFAGRLVPEKNPGLVLDVATELRDRGYNVKAHFFGDGPLFSALKGAEDCVLHGWVDDWVQYLSGNDVLILPSSVEGFGNVLVEAASAGVPVVASSRSFGVADAILNSVTGVLSIDHSSARLADAVLEARELKPENAGVWLERHTLSSVGRQLDYVIASTMGSRSDERS